MVFLINVEYLDSHYKDTLNTLNLYYINFFYIIIIKRLMIKENTKNMLKIVLRYVLQGFAIAIAAYYIPVMYKTSLRKPTVSEIFSIALTAALTMFILDYFISEAGIGARLGVGFTIGKNLVTL
jgi:hypothetical protein